jgi:hypothetical protein
LEIFCVVACLKVDLICAAPGYTPLPEEPVISLKRLALGGKKSETDTMLEMWLNNKRQETKRRLLQPKLQHPVQHPVQRQNHPPLPVVLVRLNLAHCLAPNQL